jgi:hypothetical protein
MNSKTVKEVKFKIELRGSGIVNYDSDEQKHVWNMESKAGNKNNFISINKNNKYAKKDYYRDENGALRYRIKISSDALRCATFIGDSIAYNPGIAHHKTLLNSFIGSTLGLVRGYLFATKKEAFKRKSPLTIVDAIQTNNAESYMEFHSRRGEKKIKDDSESGDTTIFRKETIGKINYESEGFISIQELEFLSSDTVCDRYAFNSDDFSILKTFLSNNLPNFNSEPNYYNIKTSTIDQSEYGIKLSNENITFLIKETLIRILGIKIRRGGAFAEISKMSIQLVTDPLDLNNNNWIEINNVDDIKNLDFDVEESYILADETEAKKQREIINEGKRKEEEEKKNQKELLKAAIASKKEKENKNN